VMGRRLFDVVDGPHGRDDSIGYGAAKDQAASGPPIVVVTHDPPSVWRLGPRFSFARSLPEAVAAARAAAGDADVVVMGGGDVVHQAVAGGLVDVLRIHLSPIIMGGGTPLFRSDADAEPVALRQVDVQVSAFATHITYEVAAPTR
jgi:dihydrofolate reductase